jgi:hypothetical protein
MLILHACIQTIVASADTSVRVSRRTVDELERLQGLWHTRTADETILKLIRERKTRALRALFGSGKSLPPFSEADRYDVDG